MSDETNSLFEIRPSARWADHLEVNDTVNTMVWGPFPSPEYAEIQVLRLKTLVDLGDAISEIARIESTLWEEISIDNGADRESKKVAALLQKSIDSQLDCLKREQKLREA